jgi:hypothetical protein
MPRLAADLSSFRLETDRLLGLYASIAPLAPAHRKLVAEVVQLRLAILVENTLRSIFSKVACATPYIDGALPAILVPSASMASAISNMQVVGRPKTRSLKWNDGAEIRRNIQYLVDSSDYSVLTMLTYGTYLTDVRYVRNHIAHKNSGSRANFRKILLKYYGSAPSGVDCGTLLTTPRFTPTVLEEQIRTGRAMIRDLTRG